MPQTTEPKEAENPLIELNVRPEITPGPSPPAMAPCISTSTPTVEISDLNTNINIKTPITTTLGTTPENELVNRINTGDETEEETETTSNIMSSPSPKSSESFIHHHYPSYFQYESSMSSTTSPQRRTGIRRPIWSREKVPSKLTQHTNSVSEDDRDSSHSQYSGDRSHFSIHLPSGFSPSSVSSSPLVSMKARRNKANHEKARYASGSSNQGVPEMASIGTFFTNIGNGPKVLFSPTKSVVSFKPHHSPSKISRGRDNHEVVSMKEGKASRRARRLRKTHKTNSDYDSSSLPFTPQGKDQIPEGVCDENCDWEDDKNFRSDQECDVHNSSISILSFSQLPASSPKRLFSMTPDSKLRRYARSRKTESTQRIDGRREHRLDCQPTQTQKYDLIHTPENLPELKISDGSQDRDHNQHQHKNQYQYQLHGQHWSTSSEFNSHKGYWFTDPFLPYTLSMYFQLLFNVILSCALLYFLYAFFRTVQNDVDQLVEQFSANVIAENAQCLWDFKINNCDKDLPGIKLECLELERCFNRDPAIIGRAKLSAGAFAEIIDSFIKPISYKSISVIFILTVGSFGVTNFGFNSFRRVNKMNSNESTQG